MNFVEAVKQGSAMDRAIRLNNWPKDRYVYFCSNGMFTSFSGQVTAFELLRTRWEM